LTDGADEEIFRGVFEVDEFEKLSFVAKYFQGGGAEGIGGERAETFPKNAVLQEGGPVGVRELRREFVLAASLSRKV